jgi:hypothetical protein
VSLAGAWLNAAVAPVLVLSALGLGALGVGLRQQLPTGCGVLVALFVVLLQRRRVTAAQDRLVRMRTRLRLVRANTDDEVAAARQQVRELSLQLWEYRLLDQLTPQARTLISGMAATLARPYVGPPESFAAQTGQLDDADWDLFDTHPIDLAAVRSDAEAPSATATAAELPAAELPVAAPPVAAPVEPPRPALPMQPEPPTVELPVLWPGGVRREAVSEAGTVPAVIDLRSRQGDVDPEVAAVAADELDQRVYQQLAEAEQDELAAALEPPPRRQPLAGAGVSGTARVPDDPGRRTA